MNCAHSACSFPSGGRNTTKTKSIKMNGSVKRRRRNCPEMRRPSAVMRADALGNRPARGSWSDSCQNLSHNARRLYAGQFLLESLERIIELTMVKAQQIKHGRMQIADLDWILHDLVSHLVRLPVGDSALNTGARHPNCERARVMVPSHVLHLLTISVFAHRRPPEFSAPHDECVL